MLILGTETPFFYHLPMFSFPGFDSPHRYQVILEAKWAQDGKSLQRAFSEERKTHQEIKIYTFSPEPFVLEDLDPKTTKTPLRQLRGSIFRGHLEKGGSRILKDVTADIRPVYFKEFTPKTARSRSLEYVLFGAPSELFLAHLITAPPDFDQILSVSIPGRDLSPSVEPTNEQLKRGVKIRFPQNANMITRRLRAKRRLVGSMPVTAAFKSPKGIITQDEPMMIQEEPSLELMSLEELYLEEGELRAPPEYAPTAAEKAAGFGT
jgi:hypothetical protein